MELNKYRIILVENEILQICEELFKSSKNVRVIIPDPKYGHISTNAPMVYAKSMQLTPKEVFEKLCIRLKEMDNVVEVRLDGGFCNLTLSKDFLERGLEEILLLKSSYGAQDKKRDCKVNVEYISANPTGPLHLGHLRGLYGDILSRFLTFAGYEVVREYYINNVGHQVYVLGHSVFYHYCVINGMEYDRPDEMYPGDHIVEIAEHISRTSVKQVYSWESPEDRDYFINASISKMLDLAKQELELLKIDYDVWRYESEVHKDGSVVQAIDLLERKGMIGSAVLGEIRSKKGKQSNKEVKVLLSDDGDESKNKAITKPDGSFTYFASDIGYHYDKIKRGFNWIIDFFGADHDGHALSLPRTVMSLDPSIRLDILIFQIVDFKKNGERMKFSKRGGVILRPSEILEYLPDPGILRLAIASKKPDTHFSVDLDQISRISMDNPFYYLQYAYARSCSVIENATKIWGNIATDKFDSSSYTEGMAELLYLLIQWPREVEMIRKSLAIHMITTYLEKIASKFHSIWNEGNEDITSRWILTDDYDTSLMRLQLVLAFQYTMMSGMSIIGITPYTKMSYE